MDTEMSTVRLLGAAQLVVFAGAMLSEGLLRSVVGSRSISDILVIIPKNLALMRISNLVALLTSVGIIILGVLFYVVFHQKYKTIALVALGCFVAEAIVLAVSKTANNSSHPTALSSFVLGLFSVLQRSVPRLASLRWPGGG
jgi:hypothetical protein